jgi:hypothetical protein
MDAIVGSLGPAEVPIRPGEHRLFGDAPALAEQRSDESV